MAKRYDIVDTSKMACEYDGSLIYVEGVANTDLENGRAVVVDHTTKKVSYVSDITKPSMLHANIEKMYKETDGLTEYITKEGEYVRAIGFRVGDEFTTTAIDYTADVGVRTDYASIAVGDQVIVHAGDGKYTCQVAGTATTSYFIGEVIEKNTTGYDRIPSITIKVVQG